MSAQVEAVAECPSCESIVPMDAVECPKCGEVFADEAPDVESPAETAEAPDEKETSGGFRAKLLFYMGVVLILLGGPGIALGSWLHDVLRIAIGGLSFEAFGWVNRLVSAIGLIVLIVGIVCLVLSLRLSKPVDVDYDIGSPRES